MAALKHEIAQQQPFSGPEEEALLNVLRTADCLERAFQHRTRQWGITSTQYNVLRILRGAEPQGLTCTAIGDRMITAVPDITRLLARLATLKLIRRQRDKKDRRIVWTRISAAGLELLRQMDPVIREAPGELLGHLSKKELFEFTRLLEAARQLCADGQGAVACEGGTSAEGVSCDGKPAGRRSAKKA